MKERKLVDNLNIMLFKNTKTVYKLKYFIIGEVHVINQDIKQC